MTLDTTKADDIALVIEEAKQLFAGLALSEQLEEFLTLSAYERLED